MYYTNQFHLDDPTKGCNPIVEDPLYNFFKTINFVYRKAGDQSQQKIGTGRAISSSLGNSMIYPIFFPILKSHGL